MKKLILFFAIAITMFPVAMMGQCGTSNLTADDGTNTYQTAPIGPHCWTTTNFRATNYYDGTEIPNTFIYKSEMYPDEAANLENYGRLYTWYAAMKVAEGTTAPVTPGEHGFVQGICPDGWHLPLEVEVTQLSNYDAVALHSENPIHWLLPGTNETGQNMLPGGFYSSTFDRYENLRGESYIWTASSLSPTAPKVIWSDCHCSMCVIKDAVATNAMSVRCVYDIYRPQVVTDAWSVEEVDDNDVFYFNGNVTFAGYDEDFVRGFQYGTDPADLSNDWNETATSEGTFRVAIENVTPATTYYYRAYVTNEFGTVYGVIKSFTGLSELPAVTTDSVSTVTISSAKLHGTVTSMGDYPTASVGFKYGTSESAMNTVKSMDKNSAEPYDIAVTELLSNTTYYYQAFAAENIDTVYGAVKSFTTLSELPAVTTDSVSAVTVNSAKLHGTITSMGDYSTASVGFKYGTSENAMNTVKSMDKNSAEPYDIAVTELLSNTTYYYQAFAAENIDTVYGEVKSFTTLSELPAVTTDSVSAVTISSAKLHGTVTSMGDYPTASVGFKYGTSESAMNTVKSMDKNSAEPYDIAVTELLSNTTYYYQAFAAENIDTVYGAVKSFTTLPEPVLEMSVTTDSANAITSNSASLFGNVTDLGGNTSVSVGFKYGTSETTMNTKVGDAVSATGLYSINITGLAGTTTYYFKAYAATNATDTVWGAVKSFTTLPEPVLEMSVTTDSANAITSNSASLFGNVTDLGGNASVNAGFKYGTSETTMNTKVDDAVSATGLYSINITGLAGTTTYYFKAYAATNATDTVWGAVKSFTTLSEQPESGTKDTITFIPNGGLGTMDTMFVNRGDTVLDANTYTHGGNWQFLGWNTAADGSGTSYADQASITTDTNITLYAQWHTWCTGTPNTSVNEFGDSQIDSVKDVDNNKYAVVQIGNQCWTKENLRTSTNTASTGNIYTPTTSEVPGYDVETYGRLYDWAAVMQDASSSDAVPSGVQGICPAGWHVPSDAEWTALTDYVNTEANGYRCDGDGTIAKALSSTTGWNSDETTCNVGNAPEGNNLTGFAAVPAGGYFVDDFDDFDRSAYFWSATHSAGYNAWYRSLSSYSSYVLSNYGRMGYGFSVRCLRDAETGGGDEPTEPCTPTSSTHDIEISISELPYSFGDTTFLIGTTAGTYTLHRTNAAGCDSTITVNLTVNAQSATTATITFVPNGGQGTMGTKFVDRGAATTLTANQYTHGGNWQFLGWNTAADGSGTSYTDQASITTDTNITLYAQWHTWCTGTPNTHINEIGTDRIEYLEDNQNNRYQVIQIGNQCWMRENLRTTKYADATDIEQGSTTSDSVAYWYYPNGNVDNKQTCGLLYNWKAVRNGAEPFVSYPKGMQGICPTGWHVPSKAEWTQMTDSLIAHSEYGCGNNDKIAKALASPQGWTTNQKSCNVGTEPFTNNAAGFSAIPAGSYTGSYSYFGDRAYFWTSDQNGLNKAFYRSLYSYLDTLYRGAGAAFSNAYSVRCVRDMVTPDGPETENCGTVIDQDGNTYRTVIIGEQCWMRDNLRTLTNNGYGNVYTPTSKQIYGYEAEIYGRLYDWAAVMQGADNSNNVPSGVQGICPTGWHVPSDAEWIEMIDFVKSQSEYRCDVNKDTTIAKALASTKGWYNSPNNCTVGHLPSENNAVGFSAIPAGYYSNNILYTAYDQANYATTTKTSSNNEIWCRSFGSNGSKVYHVIGSINKYYSVRCVKN